MPRTGQSFRLLYKDSNGDNVEIARLAGDGGQGLLRQARLVFRNRASDKLSFIGGSELYDSLPVKLSSFSTSEPAVFFQEYRFRAGVTGADTTNNTFTVPGDRRNEFEEGGSVTVTGSTGNDDIYKVSSQSQVSYDSGNDESTISVEESVPDGTADGDLLGWENIFRGFAEGQGKITKKGNVKAKLFSFDKYHASEDVDIGTISTDIEGVMSNLIPSDYTLDSPSSSNVDYIDNTGTTQSGYAPVDNYSVKERRGVGYREMSRKYGYAIKYRADKTIRFEPLGFGSSIDTLKSAKAGGTGSNLAKFLEWKKDDPEDLVNTVRVVNSKDGNQYDSGIITNSSSVQAYGKKTPNEGLTVTAGYVDSDQEAERVAYNILRDGQQPVEGGRVTVPTRFQRNVSNSSFTLEDPTRGISSEVFTAWNQVNFYPENKTEFHFQFESRKEREKGIRDDVRGERSTTFGSSGVDVGQQGLSNASVTSSKTDLTVSDDDNNPGVGSGNTEDSGDGFVIEEDGNFISISNSINSNGFTDIFTAFPDSGDAQAMHIWVHIHQDFVGTETGNDFVDLRIKEEDLNLFFPNTTGVRSRIFEVANTADRNASSTVQFTVPINVDNGEVKVQASLGSTSETWDATVSYQVVEQHSHGPDTLEVSQHNHNSAVDTDPGHGAPTDSSIHEPQGSTDSKNVNVAQENKEDR
jgi:hypothetical protein